MPSSDVRQSLDRLLPGLVPDSVRLVRSHPRAGGVYLASGGEAEVCVLVSRGGGTCNSVQALREGTLVSSATGFRWQEPGEVQVQGVVPNGVRTVDVVARDGSATTVEVVGNVYLLDTAQPPAEVRWTGPDGAVRTAAVPY